MRMSPTERSHTRGSSRAGRLYSVARIRSLNEKARVVGKASHLSGN